MLLIKNCTLWTMAELNGVPGEILIDDGKILDVGEKVTIPAGASPEIIDAAGQFVMPGIVDPHCHIGMMQSTIGWAGEDTNEITDPVTPQLRGLDAIKDCDESFEGAIRGGVTTVCTGPGSANIIGGTFCAIKTYGKTIEEKVIVPELAMKMALGENPKRCYQSKGPQTRMASAAVMREWLQKAKDYKEKLDAYKASGDLKDKPAFDAKLASLARVFEGMPVKIHAHQEVDILTACRISKEFGINSTIEHCTSGWTIPEKLKEYDKKVIIGPTFTDKSKYELKDKSFDAAKVLYDNGIPFGIMTDHPVVCLENTRAQCALFVGHGLPYLEGLKAITINAARVVGLEDRVGSLEKGKDADIVIYDGDPLHYMTRTRLVLVNGQVAWKE